MSPWWLLPVVASVSVSLTALARYYALAWEVLDIPTDRSSHHTPTPRGGGVGIALAFWFGCAVLLWRGHLDAGVAAAFAGAIAVAAVGLADDFSHVAPPWRLLVHASAAAWALAWLGGLPPLTVFGAVVNLGWLGHVLALIYLVWLINLYNFMDGIDGIASVEATTVGLGAVLLHGLLPSADGDGMLPAVLAFAAAGFLWWNWPPARIFMGDVGSGFLGLTLGTMSIQSGWQAPELFWSWLILLGVFVVDSTVTLLRRLCAGSRLFEPHRTHAYQHIARRAPGHRRIVVMVAAINLVWLLPVATAVAIAWIDGFAGVVVAYAPLVWVAFKFNAGEAGGRVAGLV
ncbi:MAG: glycosyltransferase family 4 protein [Vicinamibacterales bacterium]